VDSLVQPVVGLLMLGAAVAATVMRNRLAAVLLVGITGYGCGASSPSTARPIWR
jgi:multicomponent Na+:H+ antiporter subunit A